MRSMRTVWVLGGCAAAVVFLVGTALAWAATPERIQKEYEQRFAQLKPDDLAGHYELAVWCKEHGAWELARKQCALILAQNGAHEQAKLLLELAMRRLGGNETTPPGENESARGPSAETIGPRGRLLSEAEIRRIRWIEMMEEEPKPLSIQFNNNVIQRFLEAMEGTEGFTQREDRRRFMTLKPTEKVQRIRKYTQDRFAEDMVIQSDPQRMADFERQVLPVVVAGCATARCHADPSVSRFTLYADRMLSKHEVYTNYLVMHAYRVGDKRLIKRDTPHESLLLTYGFRELPPGLDPTYKHPGDLDPVFRGTDDPKCGTVRKWLESLSALEPNYGISVEPAPASP